MNRRNFVVSTAAAIAGAAIIPELAAAAPTPGLERSVLDRSGSILATNRLVTYYGNPWSAQMGILGALSDVDLVAVLRRRASAYEVAGNRPVTPGIHMVVTTA